MKQVPKPYRLYVCELCNYVRAGIMKPKYCFICCRDASFCELSIIKPSEDNA